MFKTVTLVVLAIVAPWASGSPFCDYVRTKDCFHIADITKVCGTDGVTYRNRCTLAQAHCHQSNINMAHTGVCPAVATTPAPINGSEIAFDIFCMDVAYYDCPLGGDKICASTGVQYVNICEFDKARCSHRDLKEVTCPTTTIG